MIQALAFDRVEQVVLYYGCYNLYQVAITCIRVVCVHSGVDESS